MMWLCLGVEVLTVGELNVELEESTCPDCPVFARDRAVPALEVEAALGVLCGACYETEGMVFAPLLAVRV